MRRAWWLLPLLMLGCGPDAALSGSLGVVFPLDISSIAIAQNEEALQITYLRNRNVFLDVVVRVSVALSDVTTLEDGGVSITHRDLKPGMRIDLAGEYMDGHPRAVVAHAPGGEPVRVFPRVQRGDMHISSGGNPEEITRGNFSVLFENQGGDLGFGRTLTGDFSAMTIDAGFGDPVPDGGVP